MKFLAGVVVGGVGAFVSLVVVSATQLYDDEVRRIGRENVLTELRAAKGDSDAAALWIRKATYHRAKRLYHEKRREIGFTVDLRGGKNAKEALDKFSAEFDRIKKEGRRGVL